MSRKPNTTQHPRTLLALRILAAILLLFVGADHYYEYSAYDYSAVPTIGTLFLLNFISATAVALLILAPLERILRRFGSLGVQLAALGGFGIAATALIALLVSEHTTLFGFMESNYRPAIIVAIASEAAASVVLATLFVVARRAGSSRPDRVKFRAAWPMVKG